MDATSPTSDYDSMSVDMSDAKHPYPSPPPHSDSGASHEPSDQPQKKKRKAWGQPVPEIKQILPPRKRAKTAKAKEQRKNERILRIRRAADRSRQRQKAAVAELEARVADYSKGSTNAFTLRGTRIASVARRKLLKEAEARLFILSRRRLPTPP
jgi:hypothetical protein